MSFLRNNFGRFNLLGKLSIILITAWLFTIILSINHILKSNSNKLEQDNKDIFNQLIQLTKKFQTLKKQNLLLRNVIIRQDLNVIQEYPLANANANSRIKNDISYDLFENDVNINNCKAPLLYEELRREIRNNIQEMSYFINAELNKVKKNPYKLSQKNEINILLEQFNEYKKTLIISMDKLAESDGYTKWREKEAQELSNIVQKRFRYLQNPRSCQTAKKLLCNINKGCGFGCQIHHLVYCFLVAYGTERTLILKSKGWRYQKEGWESVFLPVSDTCISVSGESHANWPGDETKQVISLPIVDNVYPKPIFQPPSVPADLVPRLQKLHGYPLVWWVGQVLKYLMRPNNVTKTLLENKKSKIKFMNPIVGVHVRRTDKVGTEAAFHDIDEYMLKVQQYYDGLQNEPPIRRIYLASDDPKVILIAKERYPEYDIIADPDVAETASISRRYSNLSLQGIIIDIHFLSLCDYLVCTFSSQVCRVAYELMQTHFSDAHHRFASLDDVYYYGGQNQHFQTVIIKHTPKKEDEIELEVNDEIEVHGNHWDGFSKGRNLRTGMIGLFPSFKIKNSVKSVNFPKYENISVSKK